MEHQQRADMGTIDSIVKRRLDLPTPPNVVFRLLEAVKHDDHSFRQIGDIISKDPSLTARMMKVANSPMYGLCGKVNSIENALALLGVNVIRNIALSFAIIDNVKVPAGGMFDMDYFWKRAITSAVAAETLAAHVSCRREDVFLCSLLKDIGVLVMFQQMEEQYKQVLLLKAYAGSQSHLVEREIIGFDHGELGGVMLKDWGLPESIYLPIFHHHAETQVPSSCAGLVDVLQVADLLSALYHGAAEFRALEEVYDILADRYGMDRRTAERMIDSLAEGTIGILNYFDIDPGEMQSLSSLLHEAKQELGNRAMTYEQVVRELKQSQDESRQFIHKLLETNKELRKLAYRDELTGLFNHRYFRREIDQELERAKRYGHPLALVFFDLDYFKEINDSHGHLVGDVVLRTVSEKISVCMRSSDVVVRYGGDEFAIIMPETDRGGLETLSERLRNEVENLLIPINGQNIGLTISIGGASFDGVNPAVTRYAMLSVADQAIYESKKSGRNTITIKTVA